ncbi:portal protein [Bosea sp. BK604]|uniref:portal protein n=1 Tax=Bosea sp. BK604 TaxID=2512180 RepID=UPI001050D412|nr:portal protein [Bosea sp. BK604]TCR65446.1 phage P22-like portal protein [Bosea sp. BK604]
MKTPAKADEMPLDETHGRERFGDDDSAGIVRDALKLYDDWTEREQHNIDAAYDDLEFKAGNQWPGTVEAERLSEGRPVQTVNVMPQYIRQVTGDMRQMRPAIKVVPVDDVGDEEKAEARAGVIRYIENRSDAPSIYYQGGDSQVTCGIGAWRVLKEYAEGTTFNTELRVAPIDDALGVMFDLDATAQTREDAVKCLIPVDISRSRFEKHYPDATPVDFSSTGERSSQAHSDWATADTIRIAEYWYKKPARKMLALGEDGAVVDVSDDPALAAQLRAAGARVEQREAYKVYRCVVTAMEVVEGPEEWPGAYIPIIPVVGEEIRIGPRTVRHGLIRFAKDPQRSLNYNVSAETEAVALQPKAPFTGTEKNFEKYQDVWETANRKNHPYLPYTPDPANGNIPPQRVQPAVSSQGFSDGIMRAERHIQSVIGIYNASLGARSNETSGVAVNARDRQADTGTFVYLDNWSRAIRHTGKILNDLIPYVYDTARILRIIGEDGKIEQIPINQVGGLEADGLTPRLVNDVTTGSYDVTLQMGPSFSTRREEARAGMQAFMQGNPQVAPLIGDLYARSQEWPLAEEIGERLEVLLPPEIRALKAQKEGKPLPQAMQQAMQPPPVDPAQQQMAALELAAKEAEAAGKQADARRKQAEAERAELELRAALVAPAVPPQLQPVENAPDPALERMAGAIIELQGVVGQIVRALQGPPPEIPTAAGPMPIDQPPSEAAFSIHEQPGQLPQL